MNPFPYMHSLPGWTRKLAKAFQLPCWGITQTYYKNVWESLWQNILAHQIATHLAFFCWSFVGIKPARRPRNGDDSRHNIWLASNPAGRRLSGFGPSRLEQQERRWTECHPLHGSSKGRPGSCSLEPSAFWPFSVGQWLRFWILFHTGLGGPIPVIIFSVSHVSREPRHETSSGTCDWLGSHTYVLNTLLWQ